MYINPFIAGILACLLAECALLILAAVFVSRR